MPYPQCCESNVGCDVYYQIEADYGDFSEAEILTNDWLISDSSTWAFQAEPTTPPQHHSYDLATICDKDSSLSSRCAAIPHAETDTKQFFWNEDPTQVYPRLSNSAHSSSSGNTTSIILSKNESNSEYNVLSGIVSFADPDNKIKIYFNYESSTDYWYLKVEHILAAVGSEPRQNYDVSQWRLSLRKCIDDIDSLVETKESLFAEEPLGYHTLFNGENIYEVGLAGNPNSGRHYHLPFKISVTKPSWFNDYSASDSDYIIHVETDFCQIICKDEQTGGKQFGFETSGTIAAPSAIEFNSDLILTNLSYVAHKDPTIADIEGCQSGVDCLKCKQWWDTTDTEIDYLLSTDGKFKDACEFSLETTKPVVISSEDITLDLVENTLSTSTAHGLTGGDSIRFSRNDTGSTVTNSGVSSTILYYVGRIDNTTFSVHENLSDAENEALPNKFDFTAEITGTITQVPDLFLGTALTLSAESGGQLSSEPKEGVLLPVSRITSGHGYNGNCFFRLTSLSADGILRICFNYATENGTDLVVGSATANESYIQKGDCSFIELDKAANKIRRGAVMRGSTIYFDDLVFFPDVNQQFNSQNASDDELSIGAFFDYPAPAIKDIPYSSFDSNPIVKIFSCSTIESWERVSQGRMRREIHESGHDGISISSSLSSTNLHEKFISSRSKEIYDFQTWVNGIDFDATDSDALDALMVAPHDQVNATYKAHEFKGAQFLDPKRVVLKQMSGTAIIDSFASTDTRTLQYSVPLNRKNLSATSYSHLDPIVYRLDSNMLLSGLTYTEGTVSVASGVVTLSGGTWPADLENADITISDNTYAVSTRDSDTQLTLEDTSITITGNNNYYLALRRTVASAFGQTNQNSNCVYSDCLISDGTDWEISGTFSASGANTTIRPFLTQYRHSGLDVINPEVFFIPGLHKKVALTSKLSISSGN